METQQHWRGARAGFSTTVAMSTSKSSTRVSLAQRAYASMLDRIRSGELAFGDPVSRRTVARQLEMSLPPIAEAFQRLELEGLLESRPRVGTRVRTPSTEDVRGHYLVREALECQAARLFATRASAGQRDNLVRLGSDLDTMLRSPKVDRVEYLELHEQFHRQVPQAADSDAFLQSFEKTQIPIWTWISCSVFWVDFPKLVKPTWKPRSHRELAEDLNSMDVARAEAAMRSHVWDGLQLVLKNLESSLDRPNPNGPD